MGSVAAQIHATLEANFHPFSLTVVDDSARHAGHAGAREGGESHFTVTIISEKFTGMSRVARHRAVYAVLQPLFDTGLHALNIDAKTPVELA